MVFSILLMSLFRYLALGPLSGAFQVCRNGLPLAFSTEWGRATASMIWSMTIAHFWHDREKFRYVLSQIISIASFLDLMSRIFRPSF